MQDIFDYPKRKILIEKSKQLQHQDKKGLKHVDIYVHRNHAFEPLQSVISPFLHFCGIHANFLIGSYDDSLNFDILRERTSNSTSLHIIFLDLYAYKGSSIEYIASRIKALRHTSPHPILVLLVEKDNDIVLCKKLCKDIEQCEIFSMASLIKTLYSDITLFDIAKLDISGTRLSNASLLALAQILGLSLIPSFILPKLKAIALDLDNTLYDGVLGEDGIDSIVLTPAHIALHKKILALKKEGFLLAIVSKNEIEDVEKLFSTRNDFLLSLGDFDCIKANWQDKRKNLAKIADSFNIGMDSILFIDDNIAEIENVAYSGVKSILVKNIDSLLKTLEIYPCLRNFNISHEDTLRSKDIRANIARKKLDNLSNKDYFSNLAIKLSFNINNRSHAMRITELLNKTNQFIATFLRPNLQDIYNYMDSKNHAVISISMIDRLSDSGIIAILIAKNRESSLHIIELCVSCRALGRRLENIMLYHSFSLFRQYFGVVDSTNIVHYVKGPRNKPFLDCIGITNSCSDKGHKTLSNEYTNTDGLIIESC